MVNLRFLFENHCDFKGLLVETKIRYWLESAQRQWTQCTKNTLMQMDSYKYLNRVKIIGKGLYQYIELFVQAMKL